MIHSMSKMPKNKKIIVVYLKTVSGNGFLKIGPPLYGDIKILSNFNNFGVKWSALDRMNARKKLEVKIFILANVMDKIRF